MRHFVIFLTTLLQISTPVLAAPQALQIKGQSGSTFSETLRLQVPSNQVTSVGDKSVLLETGNNNLLVNPSFEHSTATTGWTCASFVVCDPETSEVRHGKKSLKVTPANVTGLIISQDVTPTIKLQGMNLEYTWRIKTSNLTSGKICSRQAGATVGTCQDIIADGTWREYTLNYPGPSSGSVGVSITGTSSSGDVYVDDAYLGPARNIGTVAQAITIGGVKYVGATNCAWTTTGGSYADFSANTSCSTPTAYGNATAPGTKIPQVTFASLAPGDYYVDVYTRFDNTFTTSNTACSYLITDGTSSQEYLPSDNQSSSITRSGPFRYKFSYTSPQSNVTFKVQGQRVFGGGTCSMSANSATSNFEIAVQYFPSQAQTVTTQAQAADLLGTVFHTGASTCPANSLPADGTAVSRSTYATLFNKISTTFGTGDGSTTFNVPDMRGVFVRGSGSQTISSITYSGTLGTKQGDQMQGHFHRTYRFFNNAVGGTGGGAYRSDGVTANDNLIAEPITDGANGTPRTGSETRPANIAMTPCIWTVSQPYLTIAQSVIARDNTTGVTTINTVVSKSANYTATTDDETIKFTASATLSLPPAANVKGKKYNISSSYAGAVIIDPNSAETICGQSTISLYGSSDFDDGVEIQSDGTNWIGLNGACQISRTALINCNASSAIPEQIGSWAISLGNAVDSGSQRGCTLTMGGFGSKTRCNMSIGSAVPTPESVDVASASLATFWGPDADWFGNISCTGKR